MTRRQQLALLATLVVGTVLRASATGRVPNPDASGYLYMARQMSWLDPWRASPREPLWIAFVKLTTAPFGYQIEAMQAVSCLVAVIALVVCVWSLRQIGCHGWLVVAGTAAIAVSARLIDTAGQGTRESTTVLVSTLAVGLAASDPRWLPVLGAAALAIRWELGLALMAVTLVLLAGRVIPVRWALMGAALTIVLMGPFLLNNRREYGDPLYHSNLHATFYRNLEETRGVVLTEPLLPPGERIRPEIKVPMYRGPLITWTDFVVDVLGPREVARREAKAIVVLPVDALRLGWLPWPIGSTLVIATVVAAVRRRDRVVVVVVGLAGSAVIGYGMLLPWFDRRLDSHLTVLLVLMLCAGCTKWATPAERSATSSPPPA